jgi:hypothetical protein
MKKELELKLKEDFPILYADLYGDMRQTCMTWGFGHGNGWHDLIRNLSVNLTEEINKLPEEERHLCKASQVKEKYGTLRFYMNHTTDEMDKLINEAEDLSAKTCEVCGALGKITNNGWIKVLCDEHARKEK